MDPGEPEAYRSAVPTVQHCLKKDPSPVFPVMAVIVGTVSIFYKGESQKFA
jgi:hypothetical protein